jgi:murein DD-endopeptidase MepM/ murein hydrolase activator NlpD
VFKNGYKIIFIKEGKFDLKQFTISPLQIGFIAGAIVFLTSSFFFMFSDQFVEWAGSHEIEKHRKNNKVLVQNIEENQERIENLLDELNELKKQDDILRRLVKLPPIHDDIRKMGFGGTHNKTETEDVNYLLPEDHIDADGMIDDINYVNRLINLERLSYNEITEQVESNKDKILAHPAIHPVELGLDRLSSNYGYRRDPFSQKFKFHDGHDYSARIGTDVHSTANGRVRKSKYWGSFGNYIEIDHGNGYITAYGHLSNRSVKVGDKVNRGQKIGEVGNTGRSTAPHLHYEVQYKNKAVDPSPFYFDIPVN